MLWYFICDITLAILWEFYDMKEDKDFFSSSDSVMSHVAKADCEYPIDSGKKQIAYGRQKC